MEKQFNFLRETEGFAGIMFVGMHNDFSLEFIDKCYKKYKKTGENYLSVAQRILMISWNYDSPEVVYDKEEISMINYYLNDKFIRSNLDNIVLERAKIVINREL